jgi:phage shock protein PspC (stress-responsive transcriptional regulator)/predicted membrane protein
LARARSSPILLGMTETTSSPTPPEPEPERSRPRRLRRSRDDRMIAGVSGGIGEYFNIDPVLVRIAFVALALFGGAGLVVYPLAWIFVPDADGSYRGGREVLRVGALVLGVVLTAAGLFLAATAVAIAVLVAGIAIFVAAFGGGKLRWLIVPALAVALGATSVAAADVDLHGGVKDSTVRPVGVQDLQRSYKVGVGRLVLDLRNVDFPRGDTRIDAKVGVGELQVLVPRDVCVASDSEVHVGDIRWFRHHTGGTDLDLLTQPSEPDTPRLVIRGDVGVGLLEIDDIASPAGETADGSCAEVKDLVRPH